MSTNSQTLNTGQQATTNYDVSKIFVWENRYSHGTYWNSSYNDVTLVAGTLMGRILANGQIVPMSSTATDGSQIPVGILAQDAVVAAGSSANLFFCWYGDVVEDKIIFQGGDNMNTVVSGKLYRDWIASNMVGVRLVPSTEMTGYDN